MNDENTKKLKEIKDEVFQLAISPLYKYRVENKYFPVIGEGSHSTSIMFIGEAPGKSEAMSGRPFCGASGKFLDVLLESINLKRSDVYITNLVKDRPPENRDPEEEEIKIYSPFLNRQIQILKPKVIVTLGRYSMKYIFNLFGLDNELSVISKMHGKEFTPKTNVLDLPNLPVILTLYHPAVALYNGSNREVLIQDFKILKKYIL